MISLKQNFYQFSDQLKGKLTALSAAAAGINGLMSRLATCNLLMVLEHVTEAQKQLNNTSVVERCISGTITLQTPSRESW